MASAAELRFLVSVQDRDLKRLQAEIRETNRALGKDIPAAAGRGSAGLGRLGRSATIAGAALLGGLALGARAGFKELAEGQKVAAQTAAVIKSTGGAAKVTGAQVEGLAERLSRLTGVDDEVIQAGQNMLLTFKNIRNEAGKGNDIFDQSTTALLDMSVAMGKEPREAAIQLGKALNDPVKGVTALGRAGVQFTAAQKTQIGAMVESGNVMGAQKLILAELTSQFGGSGVAFGETFPGQVAKAKNSLEQMAASILQGLVPALGGAAGALGRGADFLSRHSTLATALTGSLALLGVGLLSLNTALKLHTFFTSAATAAQRAFLASMLTNPITITIVALVALGAALVVAYQQSQTFRDVVGKAMQAVGAVSEVAQEIILGVVGAIGELLGIGRDIKAFFESLSGGTKGTTKDVVKGLGQVKEATRQVAGTAKGAAGDYAKAHGTMQAAVAGTAQVERSLGKTTEQLAGTFARNWDSAADKVVVSMAAKAPAAGSAGTEVGNSWIRGIVAGANAGAGAVNAAFGNVVAGGQAAGRAKAKANSPSEVTKELGRDMGEGLVRGVKEKAAPLALALTDAVRGAITSAKANVQSLASGLAGIIGTAIGARAGAATSAVDAGPEAAALRNLEAAKAARQLAAEQTRLLESVHAASVKLAAGEAGAQAELSAAHVALAEWEADQQIAAAQKVLEERKAKIGEGAEAAKVAVDQGLADLASAFARGKITSAEYLEGQKKIVRASEADFASIGALLGSAFVTGYNEQIAALTSQVGKIAGGPQAKGGLGPTEVGPLAVQYAEWEATRRNLANTLASVRNEAKLATGPGKATITKGEQDLIDTAAKNLATWMRRKPGVRSYQHGIDYVPSTGPALLHRGERVVPAERNQPGASVTIHVAQMVVRETADIDRVAAAFSRKLAVAGVRAP